MSNDKHLFSTGKRARNLLAFSIASVSITVTIGGMLCLIAFDHSPAPQVSAPTHWPTKSLIYREPDRAQLLIFVHPFCDCTRASIAELSKLPELGQAPTLPQMRFVVFRPDASSDWKWGSTAQKTALFARVPMVWDDGGREAKRFGASASGAVVLYGTGSELLFQGGVTVARGHDGENYGLTELRRALHPDPLQFAKSMISAKVSHSGAVFGCALGTVQPTASNRSFWLSATLAKYFEENL